MRLAQAPLAGVPGCTVASPRGSSPRSRSFSGGRSLPTRCRRYFSGTRDSLPPSSWPRPVTPPASFDWAVMLVATLLHFALSITYGLILARLTSCLGLMLSLLAGAAFGVFVFAVNMYGSTAVFPWFEAARDWVTVAAHLVFGIAAAGVYKVLLRLRHVRLQRAWSGARATGGRRTLITHHQSSMKGTTRKRESRTSTACKPKHSRRGKAQNSAESPSRRPHPLNCRGDVEQQAISLIIVEPRAYSPSNSATDCSPSTCSDTTFTMTTIGMLSNIPHTPQSQAKNSNAMKTAAAFIFAIFPVIQVVTKIPTIVEIAIDAPMTRRAADNDSNCMKATMPVAPAISTGPK